MSIELTAEPTHLTRFAVNGPTMGARWSAVFFAPATLDVEMLRRDLQAAVDRVDQQMSTWKPDSDLNRLNDSPVGAWVDIPAQLTIVLDAALSIGRASDGLFDVGVGDLVKAWGFGSGTRSANASRPGAAITEQMGHQDAPKNLQLDTAGRRARRLAPLRVDLSGIAKGFGVDELARVMHDRGVDSFLVGIDGEMRASGTKRDGRAWAIGHERPLQGSRELAGVLELRDAAVATSGTYRHVAMVNGRAVSHNMDPRTGAPLSNDLAAVTVLAPTCMIADAWATALLVAGTRNGLALARAQALTAIFVPISGEVISTIEGEPGLGP